MASLQPAASALAALGAITSKSAARTRRMKPPNCLPVTLIAVRDPVPRWNATFRFPAQLTADSRGRIFYAMTGTGLLFLLAAIAGLVGAGFWLRVALTLTATPDGALKGNRRALGNAVTATGIAMALASAGVLLPALLA